MSIFDFTTKSRISSGEVAVSKIDPNFQTVTAIDLFYGDKPDNCFICRAGNDYGELRKNDFLIVETNREPKRSDYIAYKGKSHGIIKFSDFRAVQHGEILGVVINIIRALV